MDSSILWKCSHLKGEGLNWDSFWMGSLFKTPGNESVFLYWVHKGQCNCGPSRPVSILSWHHKLAVLFLQYSFSRHKTWKIERVIQIFDYTSIELLRPGNVWQEFLKLVPKMLVHSTMKVMSKFQWKFQNAGDARTMGYPGKKSGEHGVEPV